MTLAAHTTCGSSALATAESPLVAAKTVRHFRATIATSPTRSSWSRVRLPSTSNGFSVCGSSPGRYVSSASSTASASAGTPTGGRASAATMPAGMFAPDAFVTTGPAACNAAASSLVVVVLPFVADTKTTRRPSTSIRNAAGHTATTTRPPIATPSPRPSDFDSPPATRPRPTAVRSRKEPRSRRGLS